MRSLRVGDVDSKRLDEIAAGLVAAMPTQLVVGLIGTLGAGKTTLVKSIAAAAGVDSADVTSPTFTLLCSHRARVAAGPVTLHHLDVYRVSDEDEFFDLGVEELWEDANSWVLIEWADRFADLLPDETLFVQLELASACRSTGRKSTPREQADLPRELTFRSATARLDQPLDRLRQTLLPGES